MGGGVRFHAACDLGGQGWRSDREVVVVGPDHDRLPRCEVVTHCNPSRLSHVARPTSGEGTISRRSRLDGPTRITPRCEARGLPVPGGPGRSGGDRMDRGTRSAHEMELVAKAGRYLAGGTLGNLKEDVVLARGRGSRVWDVSGRQYVDYLLGSGPMLVGHAHPEVVSAVREQVEIGSTFFANNEPAILLDRK